MPAGGRPAARPRAEDPRGEAVIVRYLEGSSESLASLARSVLWPVLRPKRQSVHIARGALAALVLGAIVAGCGRGSFVGRGFDNFTAYYNTFYNAKMAFEKGLESITESEVEIDRARYASIFSPPEGGASSEESFEKAVQKSADLLREHPNSKWVDDALMIIGRSYYYQQNYVGAAQKFREVIALEAEREGEARFRLAQTLVATERFAEASDALAAALEGDEQYGTWTARMYLLRGELLVRQEQWENAESALERGLDGELPDDVGALGVFLLGQVRETLGDYSGARTAYRRVPDYNPRYPVEFAARLNAIEMQGVHGDADAALNRLKALERGDDTREMRSEIAVVRARLYQAQNRPGEARSVLLGMLRDEGNGQSRSTSSGGAGRGRIHYELGTLYRDAYEDFTRAAAHFDTAATAMPSGEGRASNGREGRVQALPRAPSDAQEQSDRFSGLADRANAVARMDSLLRLGRMEASEFQATVQKIRAERLRERQEQARERERQRFGSSGSTNRQREDRSQTAAAAAATSSDAGFLFHRDPTQVQQGRRQFRQTWGDRPRVDNWRRRTAIQGGTASADSGAVPEQREETASAGPQGSAEPVVDVSAVPRDSASQAEMERARAFARYELANALFRAASRPDSAETWYRRVLDESTDSTVVQQALYALAQSHLAQGDTLNARETYRRVIAEYPGTPVAQRSRQQLGLDRAEPAAGLMESRADSAYTRAYRLWQEGPPGPALDSLFSVVATYPQTRVAPKALLAAGVLYYRSRSRDTSSLEPDSTRSLQERLTQNLDAIAGADSTASDTAHAAIDTLDTEGAISDSTTADTTASRLRSPSESDSMAVDSTRGSAREPDSLQSPVREPTDRSVESRATPDTTGREPDTTTTSVPSDSVTSPPPPDSLVADTTERSGSPPPTGTSRAASDRTLVRDTTATPVREPRAEEDSVRRDVAQNVAADTSQSIEQVDPLEPLRRLLSYLSTEYPDTPQSKRATALLDGLKQRARSDSLAADSSTVPEDRTPVPDSIREHPPSDSLAVPDTVAADSLAADTASTTRPPAHTPVREGAPQDTTTGVSQVSRDTTRSDSERPMTPPDTTGGPGRTVGDPAPPDSMHRARADSSSGRWTLLVSTTEREVDAEARRENVVQQIPERWSVRVLTDSTDGSTRFRVVVGRFSSEEEAQRARALLRGPLSESPEVWKRPANEGIRP